MHFITHTPPPPLAGFVSKLWFYDAPELPDGFERMLPSGTMSLLINLAEDELRWYEGDDPARSRHLRGIAVSGAYARSFTIDTAEQRAVVGAEITASGAFALFGSAAGALRDTHASLEDLWGPEAGFARERVLAARSPEAMLAALQAALLARIRRPPERDPAIAFALAAFTDPARSATVSEVTSRLGMSPRRFIATFTAQVGLTPKLFCRVQRFQQVLAAIEQGRALSWARVALACGYYDQAHFIHDFRGFAGVTPTEYVTRHRARNHLPIAG